MVRVCREPGSREAIARLAGGQVELDDGPAEGRPFDVDEGDQTGVDRIEFGRALSPRAP